MKFLARYLSGIGQRKRVAKLLPIVEKAFEHPWVTRVQLKIRFAPGNDGHAARKRSRAQGLPEEQRPPGSMYWDAPITVSVFRNRRGRNRQALCMSLYLTRRIVYIAQLQGVAGTTAPNELREWPKLFIEACRTLVRQEGLRELRIPRAQSLYSYKNPGLNPDLLPEIRDSTLQRIRRNMSLLYDKNASDLGFVADGDWLRWQNVPEVEAPGLPSHAHPSAQARHRRAPGLTAQ